MIVTEAIHTAQANVDEAIRVMDENAKRNLNVLQKAIEVGQAESASKGQAKAQEVWEAGLNAIREDTQAVVQAQTQAVKSWTELGRKVKEKMASVTS